MEDLTQIIEQSKEAIVVTHLPNGTSGTGFFLNERGLLITNKHTVGLYTFVKTVLHDGSETDSMVLYSNNDVDFAFAIASIKPKKYLQLGDSDEIKEGETMIAIGHPYGYDFTVSRGIVSCKCRTVKGIPYIQTDVAINPGNSGGPLLNTAGKVVGINTWVVSSADNMSFAIPVNTVKRMFEQLNGDLDKATNSYYCPVCGFLSDTFIKTIKAEYCVNCGTIRWEKNKEKELPAVKPQAQAKTATVSMVPCPKCQTPNDSSSNFCKNCGFKIK